MCHDSNADEKMQFGCSLTVTKSESEFKIIEHNEFKSLDHLVLRFQQPSDEIIKNYLSDCLLESKDNEYRLEKEI